jgi:hypothetical protein
MVRHPLHERVHRGRVLVSELIGRFVGVGALEELRAGRSGRATLDLVMRAGARAVRGFPPPEGYGAWSDDAVADEMGELFSRRPHLLTRALAAGVEDDDALEAYLVTSIGNALKDQAKSTDVGKLRRRFVNVLGPDERFVRSTAAGEAWALTEFTGNVWSGDLVTLRAAAGSVRGVFIEKLNEGGPTPAPVRHALVQVAAAVLTAARGAVSAQDLAQVVFERFFPGEPEMVWLDAPCGERVADPRPVPESRVLAGAAAHAVWTLLNAQETALVPRLGETPTKRVGVLPGAGPEETEAIAGAVIEKIRLAVIDKAEAADVVLALRDLCSGGP